MERMAILGWGSLIWDVRREFVRHLDDWRAGGPHLPIEFARKSVSRSNALTLVIDRKIGTPVETLYAISKRTDPRDVICDLRSREGTTAKNIGFVNVESREENGRDEETRRVIKAWALLNKVQFVAWTDLEASFSEPKPEMFVTAALAHLKSLDVSGLREAVKYVLMAPAQTDTYLRKVLMKDRWFKDQIALYKEDASHTKCSRQP